MSEKLSGVSVFLVGMMGSGKSTVGNLFCKSLGSYTFLDMDTVIEGLVKVPVSEFFAAEGEESFREFETAVLAQAHAYVRMVVSTGGGIVVKDANWGKLKSGIVVFLDVPPEAIAARIASKQGGGEEGVSTRPLLAGVEDASDVDAVAESLAGILSSRRLKYEQADVVVRLNGTEALDDCALMVIDAIESFIAANPPKWKQWKEKAGLPQA